MTKLKNIKGVIFDKDGTLFDFNLSWSNWAVKLIETLSKKYKVEKVKIANAICFNLHEKCFYKNSGFIAGTLAETVNDISKVIPNADKSELKSFLVNDASNQMQAPIKGLVETLKSLRDSGLILGVATNDAEISAIKHLKEAQIMEYFEFVAGYDSGCGSKPEPGQILSFCAKMTFKPSNVLMVGDSKHDLIASKKAGSIAVAVLTGVASKKELMPHAHLVLDSIVELPSLIIKTTKNVEKYIEKDSY